MLRSVPDKRLILDRNNYYAVTGGHGACRGCGQVTAIRMVMAANHAMRDKRSKEHVRELEGLGYTVACRTRMNFILRKSE